MATFSTLGNASVQICVDSKPILSTDPWLTGTCYFGSWALHHPLSAEELQRFKDSAYIWISHGHPDHLHFESLELLPKGKKVLLPDHYSDEISKSVAEAGFDVEVMQYKKWYDLGDGVEVLCLDNINQDAILIIRVDDALIINMNDSPLCGEQSFIADLVRRHPNDKTFLSMLCGVAADMLNYVDQNDAHITEPAAAYKPGCVWSAARLADTLGVKHFCMSSSQHLYVRADSAWANEYDISFAEMTEHWTKPGIKLTEPFVTFDLAPMTYQCDWPSLQADLSRITDATGEDDWGETLSAEEWEAVEQFIRSFETLTPVVHFVEFKVGEDSRRIYLNEKFRSVALEKQKGVRFIVPRRSLLEAIKWGYFDDLLIGNFMKTELINIRLYPDFTPRLAKYGGNAKVFTMQDYRRFKRRYFWRNPVGMTRFNLAHWFQARFVPWATLTAEKLGVKRIGKWVYRRLILGDPVGNSEPR